MCGKVETLEHRVYDYKYTNNVWFEVERWTKNNTQEKVNFGKESLVIRNNENSVLVNHIILANKYIIHNDKR